MILYAETEVSTDLKKILECPSSRLEWDISLRSSYQRFYSTCSVSNSVPSISNCADLYLTFYIDNMAALSQDEVLTQLEGRISEMCCYVGGVFLNRNIQLPSCNNYYSDVQLVKVSYIIKLDDIDTFAEKLRKFTLKKLNEEFIKVLEETLQ